jgi:hypothetical protein
MVSSVAGTHSDDPKSFLAVPKFNLAAWNPSKVGSGSHFDEENLNAADAGGVLDKPLFLFDDPPLNFDDQALNCVNEQDSCADDKSSCGEDDPSCGDGQANCGDEYMPVYQWFMLLCSAANRKMTLAKYKFSTAAVSLKTTKNDIPLTFFSPSTFHFYCRMNFPLPFPTKKPVDEVNRFNS